MRARSVGLAPFASVLVLGSALAASAQADAYAPVLHERIPPDPREDVALSVSLDGELPAAIDTPGGLVQAPDPRRPPSRDDPRATPTLADAAPNASFRPDRDTRRPDVLPYDDPFTPSTAPFKRLLAFDTVDAAYTLGVRDPRLVPLPVSAAPAAQGAADDDGADDRFFADLVVDLTPERPVRIPSVGPGARVVRARAGVGTTDVPFRLYRDGAENWFVQGEGATRARLVMELAIPRTAFGGPLGDPGWAEFPKLPPLPPNVARAANEVATRIGVSRAMTPREVVTRLVAYFRAFADSDEPPPASGDIYLDLALSKKGVCRHRAFAFLVTALGLGLPTRMVTNEAHAWVEVFDGASFRRIDLGGAGRALDESVAQTVRHEPPSDPFAWPPNASRGDDLGEQAAKAVTSGGGPTGASSSGGRARGDAGTDDDPTAARDAKDERPTSEVTLEVLDQGAHRGAPLRVKGAVTADGSACPNVIVELVLSDGRGGRSRAIGALATDARGTYDGAIVVPKAVPLGDYELVARTPGDARCGRSARGESGETP